MTALQELPRTRRRLRLRWQTPVTMVMLLGILAGGSWWGWNKFRAGGSGPECYPVTLANKRLPANYVQVDVFNAGARTGAAATTGSELRRRGFVVGKITNDEEAVNISYALVRGHSAAAPEVRLVLAQFDPRLKIPFQADNRPDHSIDVLLGPKFTRLGTNRPASIAVPSGSSCVPRAIPGVTPPAGAGG